MSNSKIIKVKQELEAIRKANGGFLSPEKVVEFARKKNTALHSQFCWDDTEAANRYRIHQASALIRSIRVEITPNKDREHTIAVREYVSLPEDRGDRGYRHITEVMSEDSLRLQFIESVQTELQFIESVQTEFEAFKQKLKLVSDYAYQAGEKVDRELQKEKAIAQKRIAPRAM